MAGNRECGESRNDRVCGDCTDGPVLMRSRQRFSDVYGQGCQRKVVWFPCSLSSHSLNVVCLLVTSREVPGEGLSVLV